jgi:molecular chaperone GrpE
MSKGKKKQKIKIADAEEVARYAGSGDGGVAAAEPQAPDGDATPKGATAEEPGEQPEEQPRDELAELRAKVEDLNDKHQRALAELRNYQKRAATEKASAIRYASADLFRSLLPVVDDLERSLASVPDDDSSSLAQGVRLVHQNLLKALEAHHVERIQAVGQPFDPVLHEAMMQQPSEEHPPGTVLEEYLSGYKLWDRVLRHSKVVVSKSPDADVQNEEQEGPQAEAQPAEGERTQE